MAKARPKKKFIVTYRQSNHTQQHTIKLAAVSKTWIRTHWKEICGGGYTIDTIEEVEE